MKKQKIALLLSLTWFLGMIAVFSFPPNLKAKADRSAQHSVLNELGTLELTLRISGDNPEVPGFKANANFVGFLGSDQNIYVLSNQLKSLSPNFFKKSRPLFDVLITFFYFFHTW